MPNRNTRRFKLRRKGRQTCSIRDFPTEEALGVRTLPVDNQSLRRSSMRKARQDAARSTSCNPKWRVAQWDQCSTFCVLIPR